MRPEIMYAVETDGFITEMTISPGDLVLFARKFPAALHAVRIIR